MHVDDQTLVFAAPCLLLVPSGRVHGFAYEVETVGSVLTIADSYLRDLTAREPAFASLFRAPRRTPLDARSRIAVSLAELSRELVWTAPGGGAAAEAHLLTILVEALRRQVQDESVGPALQGGHVTLVARFRELIEAHYRDGLPMETYASKLGVALPRLRAACMRAAGVPPLRLVQDRLILEAKRALLYSNMTIAEVAYHLGFDDPAYFSRFFAKAEGRSPKRYRLDGAARAGSLAA